MEAIPPKQITLYGRPSCPMVAPVKNVLDTVNAPYEYIDIKEDQEAAAHVREINNGYESVPTLTFPDGSTLTEPSFPALNKKLKKLGYAQNRRAYIAGVLRSPVLWITLAIVIYTVLSFFEVI